MERKGTPPIANRSAALLQRANESQRQDRWIRLRMLGVAGIVAMGFGVVILRAADLQLREQESLRWVAKKQYRAVIPTAPRRGRILDAKGNELAVDIPVHSIYADPRGVRDPEATMAEINRVLPLGSEIKEIGQRFHQGKKFVWVKRRVPGEVVEQVRALKIPGIHFVEETKRIYPNGMLASQILGAVGYDAEPLAGIELAYHKHLATANTPVVYQRDALGRIFYTPITNTATHEMEHVELTIDKVIQHYTESALGPAVEAAQARSGIAIVADVATGRILAMASLPSFDPNEYARYDQASWRNRAITDAFEPGSTFKVLIAAGAIEAGIDPERKFDCEKGAVTVGNAVLHDHDPYGMLSLRDIIKVSSNIGAFKVAQAMGRSQFAKTLAGFHMGSITGIDFPGEIGGRLRDASSWQPVEMATIAFGQGVSVTPLQMTMAFGAIANGGQLMQPYLVSRITKGDGGVVYEGKSKVVGTPIHPETARILTAMLVRVVEAGGTAPKAASVAYPVAGKTGTAQKVGEGSGGYTTGKFYASFIGFAPADAPRVVVYVGIDEPKGPHFGGVIAAPVFREIIDATLQYLGVPGRNAPMIVMHERPAPRPQSSLGLESKVPGPGSIAISSFVPVGQSQLTVPNLIGLPIRNVVRLAGGAGVQVRVVGTGIAMAQEPAAGATVARGGTVAVRCALPEGTVEK